MLTVPTQELPPLPGTPSSSHNATHHRLLYRGSLSLPDSYLLLDGLSFVAESRAAIQGSPSLSLLSNPLALALESMRGRPSLHLLGTERLEDVWLDTRANVSVYIHPKSILSRLYFQNILCLDEITGVDKRTSIGVRVSLTENSDPDTSDLLIYGQLVPSQDSSEQPVPSTSTTLPETLQMYAARILPSPPPPTERKPRPDDPTPRKPSAYLLGDSAKRKREASSNSLASGFDKKPKLNRGSARLPDEQVKRARELMLGNAPGTFKVPPLPVRSASLSIVESTSQFDTDVFGTVDSVKSKGKRKEVVEAPGSSELEKANKIVIKQATVTCLCNHGVMKRDEDFNELYQAIYRGVTFALRSVMRTQAVNIRIVERLLEQHARMYVNGNGENHLSGDQDARK